ncbi:MAG TPA: spondin domain-containing protein, partial [Candidatus Angelobacter sp.]|nr:spondin domain-containing protein [Candidatus Angelobacter sp.]
MLKESSRYLALTALSAFALHAAAAAASETATLSVTIKSVATDKTLKLPDGSTAIAPIAPGAYAVVADGVQVFHRNKAAGTDGLESLAEDGNAEAFIAHLQGIKGVREAGLFVPGQAFEVTARPGERLVFATMFVQSNDLFLAPGPRGIALFDAAKKPVS